MHEGFKYSFKHCRDKHCNSAAWQQGMSESNAFSSTKEAKGKMLLTPAPSHYPILLPHLSQAIQDAAVLCTLTELTQI